jgi:hypothetical protein
MSRPRLQKLQERSELSVSWSFLLNSAIAAAHNCLMFDAPQMVGSAEEARTCTSWRCWRFRTRGSPCSDATHRRNIPFSASTSRDAVFAAGPLCLPTHR